MRTNKTEYSITIKSFTFFVKVSNFSNGMMSVQVKDCSYKKRNKSLYFQVHILCKKCDKLLLQDLIDAYFRRHLISQKERRELGNFEEMMKWTNQIWAPRMEVPVFWLYQDNYSSQSYLVQKFK